MNGRGWAGNLRSPFCMARSGDQPGGRHGNWGEDAHYSFGAITDGLSNTVFMSERCASPGHESVRDDRVRGGTANVDAWNSRPQVCLQTRGAGGTFRDGIEGQRGAGSNFAYYGMLNVFFHTILPPNAPSCFRPPSAGTSTRAVAGGTDRAVQATVSSYHSGGANAAFGDGSVRFIPETIDTGPNLNVWFPYISGSGGTGFVNAWVGHPGASPFGVWGALGTVASGESASL
jgi:prepilin-type processing-associated H-X9-DG protein